MWTGVEAKLRGPTEGPDEGMDYAGARRRPRASERV